MSLDPPARPAWPVPATPSRSRWTHWLGRNWARLRYALSVEPTWLELTHTAVPVRGLPGPFAGLRIVQLSDLHAGPHVTRAYLGEAVALAQRADPDLVALTGDFVHAGHRHVEAVATVVGRLRAPLGVFAVLGNHDFSVRNALGVRRYRRLHQTVADALTGNGVRVLRNESVFLCRGGAEMHLAGVEDLWSGACDLDQALAGVSDDLPRILLAHNPQTVERLAGRRCDLMLSGHTHGGQIDLPRWGRVVLGRKARQLAAGLYERGDTRVYVHRGVGFGLPVRFRVRPEVAVLTLHPAE
jgi:predicted MPP superfamily phosphohydrolase